MAFGLILLCASAAPAQIVSFGLKGGVNTQVDTPEDIVVQGDSAFRFGVDRYRFGTQFGAYLRLGNTIFIQPELVFNSNRTDFRVGEISTGEVVTERYQYLDFPILLGLKAGPLRLQAGPVGHYFLNSKSELADLDGYEARFKQMTWGYQVGVSVGGGRVSLDARYEGNFNKAGEHVTFFGQPYHFSNNPSRFILGLNLRIF